MKLFKGNIKKTKFLSIAYAVAILGFSLMMVIVFLNPMLFGGYGKPVFLMSFLLMSAFLVSASVRIRRNLVAPIMKLIEDTKKMADGDHDLLIETSVENEVKELIESVNLINLYIRNARNFVRKIENGDLEAQYEGVEEENKLNPESLIFALLSMRNQIKQFSEQENQQKWATQGLANFIEILRGNQDDLKALYDEIISELVKYTGANQGAMFLLDDFAESKQTHLEMVSCYAYDRIKFMSKEIEKGEGLVGQSWQEKDSLYYTEIPEDYANISSGLGSAPPRSILIVPLMINQNVYGVLELASFDDFSEYKRDFVIKLGENIASTITNLKNVEQTKRLLQDSQEQSEQMRAQEEEMRQNLEELTATQEEMRRKQDELEKANGKMKRDENVMLKALEKAEQKEKELIVKTKEIEQNMRVLEKVRQEMVTQEEELRFANQKMTANENILKKAFEQARKKEAEIKKQNTELQRSRELLELKQKEAEDANLRMKNNETVLVKAVQKMKTNDKNFREKLKSLEAELEQVRSENENLKQNQGRRTSTQ